MVLMFGVRQPSTYAFVYPKRGSLPLSLWSHIEMGRGLVCCGLSSNIFQPNPALISGKPDGGWRMFE